MISFQKHTLANGLTVVAHHDGSTPMATVNMLYKVGSRNEHPDHTGFAHLFEHLMFGGSRNAPQFDVQVQHAGGESNAFTTPDFTNFYVTLPAQNVETALWLESDRMLNPLLSSESLQVQQSVVVEEFNQRYLNQPYGDVNLLLHPLAYNVHPYRWSTIGKCPEHIANATLSEVNDFFGRFYRPDNAVLVVGGNLHHDYVFELVQKWFGDIPRGATQPPQHIAAEPGQVEPRSQTVQRSVPASAIYKAFHMPHRLHPDYHTCDLLTELLANGKSSRLYSRWVQARPLFSNVDANISGSLDAGLLTLSGLLLPQASMPQAEDAIAQELQRLCDEPVSDYELEKVKNKVESMQVFAEATVMQKAVALAVAEMLGDLHLVNTEIERYRRITRDDIGRVARQIFRRDNCSTLEYQKI